MNAVIDLRAPTTPLASACRALGCSRSAVYAKRSRRVPDDDSGARRARASCAQPRALTQEQRAEAYAVMNEERFADQPPHEIHRTLLDEGRSLCSLSTLHRILRERGQNGDRRDRREPQRHAVPRLQACTPNEVWTWDCSKLRTVRPSVYLTLYVVLDLFSRYVLAWMISSKENAALATQLMNESATRYRIAPGQLTIHQDRGAPMTAHRFVDQMLELDITLSHSRPRVSNDNPMSEAQFATLKGQPDYPDRFANVAHARAWHERYFGWYNFEHHHSGLAGYTPEQVFTGRHRQVILTRQAALDENYRQHPERFVKGPPQAKSPPARVTINPYTPEELAEQGASAAVNFPTMPAVRQKITLTAK